MIAVLQSKVRKCPVIVTADLSKYFQSGKKEDIYDKHAMIAIGVSKGKDFISGNTLDDQYFIHCKNSYKIDRSGFLDAAEVQERIKIIKFSRYQI